MSRWCKATGGWIDRIEYGIPKCCYAILSSMVKNISMVLYKNKIHYWLDWGALLGLVRSGNLIEHDHDIDFGIFGTDRHKLFSNSVKNDFSKIGYDINKIGHGMMGLRYDLKRIRIFPKCLFMDLIKKMEILGKTLWVLI